MAELDWTASGQRVETKSKEERGKVLVRPQQQIWSLVWQSRVQGHIRQVQNRRGFVRAVKAVRVAIAVSRTAAP